MKSRQSRRTPTYCRNILTYPLYIVETVSLLSFWKITVTSLTLAINIWIFVSCVDAEEPTQYTDGVNTLTTVLSEQDRDLDGVIDKDDNCPNVANAPQKNGKQALICGSGLRRAIDRYVFLGSRTFRPPKGFDSKIQLTGKPIRVLLHIKRDDDSIVLLKGQREKLLNAGVKLWDYVPHYTYYASIPGTKEDISSIMAFPFVQGISAIEPRDRISRGVRRAKGGAGERQPDGTLQYAVELYPDVSQKEAAELFKRVGTKLIAEEEKEYLVEVGSFEEVKALAVNNLVSWIDHASEGIEDRDDLALAATSADLVDQVHGFRGSGLKVAMVERNHLPLPPDQHPDMTQRVIADGKGKNKYDDIQHNIHVAGIMIGDGTKDTTKRGFLPEATLITFASMHPRKTAKKISFGFPKDAREHHDAILVNYSNGPSTNCNKLGEYTKWGKYLDKAVYEKGISIIRAVGNTRGPNGSLARERKDKEVKGPLHGPCPAELGSLPHQVAKNDIAVGNWGLMIDENCGAANTLCDTSAAGPSSDGRLKPDVVAPGQGVSTTTFITPINPFPGYNYQAFGGTSAAAPVTSGVVGQIYDAFRSAAVPRSVLSIPPATAKAILIHTARDVGPWGPDYFHGWGLVNAASAVSVTLDHDKYVYEGSVDAFTADVHEFDVTGTVYGFKVTLVWDDSPAGNTETPTLRNDLDLFVTDPSGTKKFFPFDTTLVTGNHMLEALEGAKLCNNPAVCQDRVNNVEQILISDPSGAPLPVGTWTASVSPHRLVEDEQTFSLVVTPDECPVRIYNSTTLDGPVDCNRRQPLEPMAISIESDNVVLDCKDNEITGMGSGISDYLGNHTGIYNEHDGVTVSNCVVQQFDTGIEFNDGDSGVITNNTVRETTVGIGFIEGDDGMISGNMIDNIDTGIQVDASVNDGVANLTVTANTVGNASKNGIMASGALTSSTINLNTLDVLNVAGKGIWLLATPGLIPQNNTIAFNPILGAATGISLEGIQANRPLANQIFGNLLSVEVTIGIHESFGQSNQIYGNIIDSPDIGIQSNSSLGDPVLVNIEGKPILRNIDGNIIRKAATGISIFGPSQGAITNNIVQGATTGVGVSTSMNNPINVRGNYIRIPAGGTGVKVEGAHLVSIDASNDIGGNITSGGQGISVNVGTDVNIINNAVHDFTTGISMMSSSEAVIKSNMLTNLETGILVADTPDVDVTANTISNATGTGLHVIADGAQITNNFFENKGITSPGPAFSAIHYQSGSGGWMSDNELTVLSPSEHGILVGNLNLLTKDKVTDLTIDSQLVQGYTSGITIGNGVVSMTVSNNDVVATDTGLDGANASELNTIQVTCNNLVGGNKDAVFSQPVDTSFNVWSEIPAPVQVLDSDNDGYGDSGTGYIFCSSDYGGARTCPGQPFASFRTNQISDDAPWIDTTFLCPPQ